MTTRQVLEALPAGEPAVLDALPAGPEVHARGVWRAVGRWIAVLFGWCWRLGVGALLCMNYLYISGIVVTGWTYRWVQARVVRGWWKKSRFGRQGSFEDFCAGLGLEASVARPRWFWQEHVRAALTQPTPDGRPPGTVRLVWRALRLPWHSLWLNFKVGFLGLFCTFLLTGWGCLLMQFSWQFGWLNSFHKGYEQAFLGPLLGVLGIVLFIAAMFYVPMAQVHQAVTGNCWAFFDFRLVWRLIRARLTGYVGLAVLTALAALPLHVLATAPALFVVQGAFGDDFVHYWDTAGDAEVLASLRYYFLGCCFVLFPALLLLRLTAARIYRSAVLKVLRRGWVTREQLHPVLAGWLDRLDLYPPPARVPRALEKAVRFGGRSLYRGVLYGTLFLAWFGFTVQVYVGEFLTRHRTAVFLNPTDDLVNDDPLAGFLNHPLVQVPSFDFIPRHLKHAADPP
ncbi:MAG TPA: hypothetical protein VG013_07725 [Gemmataceae bacterium]|jgi:hypothetical protein|nr:hypothetical protein [Gemmataceae bacterium]